MIKELSSGQFCKYIISNSINQNLFKQVQEQDFVSTSFQVVLDPMTVSPSHDKDFVGTSFQVALNHLYVNKKQ